MEWVSEFVRATFFGNKEVHSAPPKRDYAPKERISLHGRETPMELVEKGSFRVAHIGDAQFSINPDRCFLTVNLPKQHKRNVRKDYVMPYYETLDELFVDIEADMEFDELPTMDSVRLAAEYPFYFWNGMFHCLGQLSVLDEKMKAYGIPDKLKRMKRR